VCQVQRHSVTADTPDFAVRYDVLRERREHLHPRLRSCSCEARSAGWVGGVVRSLGLGLSLSTSPRCVLRCYSRGAKKCTFSIYMLVFTSIIYDATAHACQLWRWACSCSHHEYQHQVGAHSVLLLMSFGQGGYLPPPLPQVPLLIGVGTDGAAQCMCA